METTSTHRETVRVKKLTTGYKRQHEDVIISCELNETLMSGQLTCLLGPNGCGKSTILKTLSAFIPPLSGEIYIRGKEIRDYSSRELAKVIGVVLTDRLSTANMTAEELVATGRSPYTGFWGNNSREDKRIVDEAMRLTGSEKLKGQKVLTLSDGERQKVMIAKALAQQTPVIFLDEPTSFLDYPSKVDIMMLLRDLACKYDKTVFLSTHDLEIALQIADRIWLMDKQYGVKTGSPEELSNNGDIGRYFDRDRMTYDPSTKRFKIKMEI